MKKIIILLLFLLLTGCYNYRELDELAIMSAIGLDIKDDNYLITTQIVNISKKNSDMGSSISKPEFNVYENEGKTIQEALRKVVNISPKRIYAEHLQLYIIGEELARQGIEEILDIVFRDTESRKQFLVVITEDGTAGDVLKTLTPLEGINAASIISMLETNEKYLGSSHPITIEEVLSDYLNKRKEIAIPSIKLKKENDYDNIDSLKEANIEDILQIGNTALFKNSKLLLYLNELESVLFSFLNDNINETILTLKCDDKDYMSLEIVSNKTDFKYDNNFYINMDLEANISEINCDVNLEQEKEISKLEDILKTYLKDESTKLVNKIYKDNKLDSLNINDYLYKNENKFYRTINFKDFINNLKINIKVKAKIKEKGNTLRVIKDENK